MTATNFKYGIDAIEFYPHSDEELQELIKRREVQYFRHCMSPAYPELGVNVAFVSEKPLTQALNELSSWFVQGYTVATSNCRPLYLNVQLKKPTAIVDADLLELTEQAKAEYAASRYVRNVEETKRRIEESVARSALERAESQAKAAAKQRASEEQKALADLVKAHAKPEPKQVDVAA